jgi:hypothetical protein
MWQERCSVPDQAPARRTIRGQARDHCTVASARLSDLSALEIPPTRWPTQDWPEIRNVIRRMTKVSLSDSSARTDTRPRTPLTPAQTRFGVARDHRVLAEGQTVVDRFATR